MLVDYASLWLIPRVMTSREGEELRRRYESLENVAYLRDFALTDEGKNEYYEVVPAPRSRSTVYLVRAVSLSFLLVSVCLGTVLLWTGKLETLAEHRDVLFLFLTVHLSYVATALVEAGLERYVSATWSFVAAALSLVCCRVLARLGGRIGGCVNEQKAM